jgi:thiol:disulfide interchange protein
MKRRFFWSPLVVACFFLVTGGSTLATQKTIEWHNYQTGMERGKYEKKRVFLHFYADWCLYCKKMQESTFQDPEVVEALNQDYISIRVNTDLDPETTQLFGVRPIPDSWFIYENGEPIGNRPGFISADQMKVLLKLMEQQTASAR